MAEVAPIQIRYSPTKAYHYFQDNYPGAQATTGKRGWWADVPDAATAMTTPQVMVVFGGYLCVLMNDSGVIGGKTRTQFAAVAIDTGIVSDWTITFTGGYALCLETDGKYLYIGGSFTAVDGVARPGICRYDYSGNLDTTWVPALLLTASTPTVRTMRADAENSALYLSGGFTSVNGSARVDLAKVNTNDAGTTAAWLADLDANQWCYALELDGLGNIYLGGSFSTINGGAKVRLAKMTTAGAGVLSAWAPAPDNTVFAIKSDSSQNCVYIGGLFHNAGATPAARNHAAAIETTSGEVTAWNPNLNGACYGMDLYRNIVFLGGAFTTIGGTARNLIGALDNQGNLQTWTHDTAAGNAEVDQVLVHGKTVYWAGDFATVDGAANVDLARAHYPQFTDANTTYVSKAGSDAAAGTAAAPLLTIAHALTHQTGAFGYIVIADSGVYDEKIDLTYSCDSHGGIYAADGCAPTITRLRGCDISICGARKSRTYTSGVAVANTLYVAKWGVDAAGVKGDRNLPYLTIAHAVSHAAANDCIMIVDDGTYNETVNCGATNLVFEAENGKMPTWTWAAALVVQGTGNMWFYGINFSTPIMASTAIITGGAASTIRCYDCTFTGHYNHISSALIYAYNCVFSGASGAAILPNAAPVASASEMRNCYFADNYQDTYSTNTGGYCEYYCEHQNSQIAPVEYAAAGAQYLTLESCVFESVAQLPSSSGIRKIPLRPGLVADVGRIGW